MALTEAMLNRTLKKVRKKLSITWKNNSINVKMKYFCFKDVYGKKKWYKIMEILAKKFKDALKLCTKIKQ